MTSRCTIRAVIRAARIVARDAGQPAGAVTRTASCGATKLRVTGRTASCVGAGSHLAGRFAGAERRGGCATVGDAAEINDLVDGYASTVASTYSTRNACALAKIEAEGRQFERVMRAYARDLIRADAARLAAAPAAADAQCFSDFATAETGGPCDYMGNAPRECRERVNVWVADFRRRLLPVCGDGVRAGSEECDRNDSASCPDTCTTSCRCPVCGNGVRELGEHCDGTDDALCPGQCNADCTCATPGFCGDGFVDSGEQCDGSGAACGDSSLGSEASCVAPGGPGECRCCYAYCQFLGISLPCCPGFACIPVVAPHATTACVPMCASAADCTSPSVCAGMCCLPPGASYVGATVPCCTGMYDPGTQTCG